MNFSDKTEPYNDLPLLPPKADLETKEILTKTIKASRALAQLNGAIRNLPNPSLFLDTIHLQEAKASSEIENIITTNGDLYQAVVADKKIRQFCYKRSHQLQRSYMALVLSILRKSHS